MILQSIAGVLGLACFILSVILIRKGHPFWVLGLVILNAGLFCTFFIFANIFYSDLLRDSYHYSSILITLGIYVFIKNLQTRKLSRKDKWILGLTLIEPIFISILMLGKYLDPQFKNSLWSLAYGPVDYLLPAEEHTFLFIRWKMIFFYAFVVSFVLIFFKLLKLLKEAKAKHLSFFCNDSFQYYFWLERFVSFFGIVCLYAAGLVLFNQFVSTVSHGFSLTLYVAMGIFGVGLFIIGIYTPLSFGKEVDFEKFINHVGQISTDKPVTSEKITQPIADEQRIKLLKLLEDDSLYRNPQLSLASLAEEMDVSTRTMSRIISTGFDKNFYDLINMYRVEEVKKHLLHADYAHYSILSIGLEAGFNSKSTFYDVFKKVTGLTPTQYKKQHS